jgi:hypothetical protein
MAWNEPWPADRVGTAGHKALLAPRVLRDANAVVSVQTLFDHSMDLPAEARASIAFKNAIFQIANIIKLKPKYAGVRPVAERFAQLAEEYKEEGGWIAVPWTKILEASEGEMWDHLMEKMDAWGVAH